MAAAPPRSGGNGLAIRPASAAALSRESASESSDEGLRLSPAAARRFARRNMRRAATPDLVTSLVRPPSPDAFYMAPETHGRLLRQRLTPAATTAAPSHDSSSRRRSVLSTAVSSTAPPSSSSSNRRSGPLLQPHASSLDVPLRHGGGALFDMYMLSYVAEPDSNLLCPICHDPLVDPVTTPCDHTFCYRCIRRSIASSPSGTACPIDREVLSWLDCFSAGRLIRTQLNALVVKCPYYARGCTVELRRENIERHATVECTYREFACPDAACDKKIRFKPKHNLCPHRQTNCSHCGDSAEEAEMDRHLMSCSRTKTRCPGCWLLIIRSDMAAHRELECDGVEASCPYNDVGCPVRAMRGEMSSHSFSCPFHPDSPSGMLIRTQREIIHNIGDLEGQIRDLTARHDESTRRIDHLAAEIRRRDGGCQARSASLLDNEAIMSESRTIQDLDAGFEEVHQNLTHLEARQSMWTLNQVMPIREEVTELRNNINMVRMHVNWLLNRSREEGRIRAAAINAAAASPSSQSSSPAMRRDSSTDATVAPIPQRRRSSGPEADAPRL
ncbi:hypothetical protein CDD82_7309 [Ophiocordyceps australis]|uniref:RING-type domain-containing protein n=1 Tax=Ophiocordyceps australis TaxID=1399860 RepID=A0A2C5YRI7_9HYPO|nr:hypothetical protein CDD82_7309 [Ophiocordyceps australis]